MRPGNHEWTQMDTNSPEEIWIVAARVNVTIRDSVRFQKLIDSH